MRNIAKRNFCKNQNAIKIKENKQYEIEDKSI